MQNKNINIEPNLEDISLPKEKREQIIHAGLEEFSKYSYAEANTDRITSSCSISKGLLFHYFGTKKRFYLYCLNYALRVLVEDSEPMDGDFYEVIFSSMDKKMQNCQKHFLETMLVNKASKDLSKEVNRDIAMYFEAYAQKTKTQSEKLMKAALKSLKLRKDSSPLSLQGLMVYTNALIGQYLAKYQVKPMDFFEQKSEIEKELKAYIDLMLYGICE